MVKKQTLQQKKLIHSIISGIQEKKGHAIRVVDLTHFEDTICKYLVICEGATPTQVSAIYDSVYDTTLRDLHEKPISTDGARYALWIAMDYTDVVVHVFVPDAREFYDIDHLWEDAPIEEIPDLD